MCKTKFYDMLPLPVSLHVLSTSVAKFGLGGRVLATRALAEASWGKSANYSVLGQSQSNGYFYLKYLNFQTTMLVFLNIYNGCYEQSSLYLIIYDL